MAQRDCKTCAANGDLEGLKQLVSSGHHLDPEVANEAAKGGHLRVLKWVSGRGCCLDSEAWINAIVGGHLNILQWMRARGGPWYRETCAFAAKQGHLEILQWARQEGCPWGKFAFRWAAQEGHLEILQWLHSNGCPKDEMTCLAAAQEGHLEVLQWAHANDFTFYARPSFESAVLGGHLEVLVWIISHSRFTENWKNNVNYVDIPYLPETSETLQYLLVNHDVMCFNSTKQCMIAGMLDSKRLGWFSQCVAKYPQQIYLNDLLRFKQVKRSVGRVLDQVENQCVDLQQTIFLYV